MKPTSYFKISTLFSAAFLVACSITENGGSESPNSGSRGDAGGFNEAKMYYFYDEFVPSVGSFGIALSTTDSEGVFTELYLDFASDYFEDALQAVPASGVYTFSNSFDTGTFNNTYSTYIKKSSGGKSTFGLLDGEFSLARNGSVYTVKYNVKVGDGSTLTGQYEGAIPGSYDPRTSSDIALDFGSMSGKGMEVARRDGNVWEVLLKGDSTDSVYGSGQMGVILMMHATTNDNSLPTGKFGMAPGTKKNIEGTAEPASVYSNKMEGCYLTHVDGLITWSTPGDGYVDIARQGDLYNISFSFADANGHIVSGKYSGKNDITYNTRATTRGSIASSLSAERH
jgi:hypothetical protein